MALKADDLNLVASLHSLAVSHGIPALRAPPHMAKALSHLSDRDLKKLFDIIDRVMTVMRSCHVTAKRSMGQRRTLSDEVAATMRLLRDRLPELPDGVADTVQSQCYFENR